MAGDEGGIAEITCVPAQHFSARTPWDRDRTLWCGYLVRVDGVTIYFAGDSGYGPHFAEIGRRFPSIDVALLPIGAYEPRWFMEPVHMNPDEAVRAHLDVRPRLSVGMHFGTFQLTDEAIDEPLRALERARDQHKVSAGYVQGAGFRRDGDRLTRPWPPVRIRTTATEGTAGGHSLTICREHGGGPAPASHGEPLGRRVARVLPFATRCQP